MQHLWAVVARGFSLCFLVAVADAAVVVFAFAFLFFFCFGEEHVSDALGCHNSIVHS